LGGGGDYDTKKILVHQMKKCGEEGRNLTKIKTLVMV
jgi:hypothetical protein